MVQDLLSISTKWLIIYFIITGTFFGIVLFGIEPVIYSHQNRVVACLIMLIIALGCILGELLARLGEYFDVRLLSTFHL